MGANDVVDHYTLLTKPGVTYSCETATNQVDTELTIQDLSGTTLHYNDDLSPGQISSQVTWSTAVEQLVIIKIQARGGTYGSYQLSCRAFTPVTATPPPTLTAFYATPVPTRQASQQQPPPNVSIFPTPQAPQVPMTATMAITPTETVLPTSTPDPRIPLTVRRMSRASGLDSAETSQVSLLIYYDANNDRKPSPNEGVPNVSGMVVNGNGRALQQAFSTAQGEVRLSVPRDAQRIVVPFVSGWSETIQHGVVDNVLPNTFQIGLQAVEIPVFIPVQTIMENDDGQR